MAISTEVTPRNAADIDAPITAGEVNTLFKLGHTLAQSRFFRDAATAEKAFAKLLFGRDLGLSATQSLTDIHIIEGKPEMSANLHASKVLSSGRYDYTILVLDENECSIEFTRTTDGKRLGVSTFTMEDALRARLVGRGADNYTKFSRNMLFARAMTNGVGWYCPDVFNGIRVYAEGEIQQEIAARSEPDPATTPAAAGLSQQTVDELVKGINLVGWDDATLAMTLADIGLDDVSDPLAKIPTLNVDQAAELNSRLSAAVDAGEQEEVASVDA